MRHAKVAVALAPIDERQSFTAVWPANGVRKQTYHMSAFKSEYYKKEDPKAHAPDVSLREINREIFLPEKKDADVKGP